MQVAKMPIHHNLMRRSEAFGKNGVLVAVWGFVFATIGLSGASATTAL